MAVLQQPLRVQQTYYVSDAKNANLKKKGQIEAAGRGAPPSPDRGASPVLPAYLEDAGSCIGRLFWPG
jgi:hypothetical protein